MRVIDTLCEEHRTLDALLSLIDREAAAFDAGGQPDYGRVADLVRYLVTFPERGHHAREDAVMRRLARRAPALRQTLDDLAVEHQHLSGLLRRFNAAVDILRRDTSRPCDWFPDLVREIVPLYRRHMWLEEEVLFPAAARQMTPADWLAVSTELAFASAANDDAEPEDSRRDAALQAFLVMKTDLCQ